MAKKLVALTNEEIRLGQMITERAKSHLAALEALKATEMDYMTMLREKYQLGPEYLVVDWMQGLEANEALNDKDN